VFSESNGRFLVTIRARDSTRFEELFDALPLIRIGSVDTPPRLKIEIDGSLYAWNVADLSRTFKETLADD